MIISSQDPSSINLAISILLAGKVVALPTDTVYGLAALANDFKAVEKLYEIKERESQKPFAILVKDLAAAEEFLEFGPKAQEIAKKHLPGKLTMVLRAKKNWQKKLAVNLNQNFAENESAKNEMNLGFRVIETEFFNQLFAKFEGIIALTSANKSGDAVICNPLEIQRLFPEILVVDGGILSGKASTVISAIDDEIKILRRGEIDILERDLT